VPVLNTLIVEGRLIFDPDSQKKITLGAHHIMVQNGGYLEIGTPNKPLLYDVEITLHGKKTDKQFMGFGNKVIYVQNSKIDIHGKKRDHTWTYLKKTVNAKDKSFELDKAVDWKVGETVVIASSSYNIEEAEQKKITAITGNVFTVDSEFKYKHYSAYEKYDDTIIPMLTEVALLSRNIVIKGADEDSIGTNYGGHMMLMGR